MSIKSTIISALAAVAVATCAADEYPTNTVTITTRDEFFKVVDDIIGADPAVSDIRSDGRYKWYMTSLLSILRGGAADVTITDEEAVETERRLDAAGVDVMPLYLVPVNSMGQYVQYKTRLPIHAAACWEYAMKVFPTRCRVYAETGVYAIESMKPADMIDVMSEWVSNRFDTINRAYYSDKLQTIVSRQVKVVLRKHGKSFVTKDGVNPLEPYAKRLEAALNAPRYEGLKELLDELEIPGLCPDRKWFLTNAELSDLIDAVMVGDIRLGATLTDRLMTALGTEAYNDFIRRYNEGE